jgi:hypothetical protein
MTSTEETEDRRRRGRRPSRPPGGPVVITVENLRARAPNIDEETAADLIKDAMGLAAFHAPCILDENFEHTDAAAALIKAAILRWYDQGSGGLSSLQADVFTASYDNRVPRYAGGFMRSEIEKLRQMCGRGGGAYTIDIAPNAGADWDEVDWP